MRVELVCSFGSKESVDVRRSRLMTQEVIRVFFSLEDGVRLKGISSGALVLRCHGVTVSRRTFYSESDFSPNYTHSDQKFNAS